MLSRRADVAQKSAGCDPLARRAGGIAVRLATGPA